MKLLCAADLHIGRRPARLPRTWAGGRISSAVAWDDLVDCAIDRQVDALLLAGDIVDRDNRYFEAYGPLGRGVRRLQDAGIAVVAVAGNHDHHTLHEVAAEVGAGHLTVLGRGGRWERRTLRAEDGSPRLHIDGWSFPASRHADDPTASYDLESPTDGAPVLALLHCDLDGQEPHYAPVPSASLGRVPVAAWIMGHIHVPRLRDDAGRAPALYAGSLLALGPGEAGVRGAWLLELEPGRPPSFTHLPLSRVRYETVVVPADGIEDVDSLRATVAAALRSRLTEVVEEGAGPLALLSCRVRVTGRTRLHASADRVLANLGDLDLSGGDDVRLAVARVDVDTRPALDLHDLARGSDAPALLARLLIGLGAADVPGAAAAADAWGAAEASVPSGAGAPPVAIDPHLLASAERAAAGIAARSYYAALPEPGDADDGVGAPADAGAASPAGVQIALRRQASRLLDELVRQKETA